MRIIALMIPLTLSLPIVGHANDVAAPAGAMAAISSGGSSTATDPPASAPAEKTPAQMQREAAEAKIKQHGINGYKPETTKAGQTVYCKTEASMGTRFETKQCRSFKQLRDEALQGKEFTEQMQHNVPQGKQ